MTKPSRLGHNSYSNPFMRPDTREGWGAKVRYWPVIGSQLIICDSDWSELTPAV